MQRDSVVSQLAHQKDECRGRWLTAQEGAGVWCVWLSRVVAGRPAQLAGCQAPS